MEMAHLPMLQPWELVWVQRRLLSSRAISTETATSTSLSLICQTTQSASCGVMAAAQHLQLRLDHHSAPVGEQAPLRSRLRTSTETGSLISQWLRATKSESTSSKEMGMAHLRCSQALLQQGPNLCPSRRETSTRMASSTLLSRISPTTQQPSCWVTVPGSQLLPDLRLLQAVGPPLPLRSLQPISTGTAAPIWQ